MHTKSLVFPLGCLLSLVITSPIWAFGREGHETTGAIAARLIAGTHAEQEVAKILKPGEDLSTAAIWADCAKGSMYCHKKPTAEMQDYAHKNPAPPRLPLRGFYPVSPDG